MGYFTDACRYCCNGDDPKCTCRCHSLTTEDIQEGGIVGCDSEEHD